MAKKLVLTQEHFIIADIPGAINQPAKVALVHKPTGLRVLADTLAEAVESMQTSLNEKYNYEVKLRL